MRPRSLDSRPCPRGTAPRPAPSRASSVTTYRRHWRARNRRDRLTGLKICGAGEWCSRKHRKAHERGGWRKLHIGVDDDGDVVAAALTQNRVDDADMLPDLLCQIGAPLRRFTGDGALGAEKPAYREDCRDRKAGVAEGNRRPPAGPRRGHSPPVQTDPRRPPPCERVRGAAARSDGGVRRAEHDVGARGGAVLRGRGVIVGDFDTRSVPWSNHATTPLRGRVHVGRRDVGVGTDIVSELGDVAPRDVVEIFGAERFGCAGQTDSAVRPAPTGRPGLCAADCSSVPPVAARRPSRLGRSSRTRAVPSGDVGRHQSEDRDERVDAAAGAGLGQLPKGPGCTSCDGRWCGLAGTVSPATGQHVAGGRITVHPVSLHCVSLCDLYVT